MNISKAEKIVANYKESLKKSISDFCKAFNLLKEEHGSYKAISEKVDVHSTTLGKYHKISQLPKGILWKFVQNELKVNQVYQISRLEKIEDQWFLAFYVIELQNNEQKCTTDDCKEMVDTVLEQEISIQEVIKNLYGEKFEQIISLLLPLDFDIRLSLSKICWEQKKELKDFCYEAIIEKHQFKDIAKTSIEHAEKLRNIAYYLDSLAEKKIKN